MSTNGYMKWIAVVILVLFPAMFIAATLARLLAGAGEFSGKGLDRPLVWMAGSLVCGLLLSQTYQLVFSLKAKREEKLPQEYLVEWRDRYSEWRTLNNQWKKTRNPADKKLMLDNEKEFIQWALDAKEALSTVDFGEYNFITDYDWEDKLCWENMDADMGEMLSLINSQQVNRVN